MFKKKSDKKFDIKNAAVFYGLLFIGLLVILFAMWWIYFVFEKPNDVSDILPGSTVFYAQADLDLLTLYDEQNIKSFFAANNIEYKDPRLYLNALLGIPSKFETDFLGSSLSIAFLNSNFSNDSKLFFVELDSYRDFKKFLSSSLQDHGQKVLKEQKIADKFSCYKYPANQNWCFNVIADYLVLTENPSNFADIYLSIAAKDTLKRKVDFQNAVNNLRQLRPLFGYFNIGRSLETKSDYLDLGDLFFDNSLQLFQSIAFSATLNNSNIEIDNYLNFSPLLKDSKSSFGLRQKYRANASSILNDSFDFVLAGQDFAYDYNVFKDLFEVLDPTKVLVLDGIMEAYKDKFFGQDIEVHDFLKLLTREYQLAIKFNDTKSDYLLALDISDLENAYEFLNKIVNSFLENNPLSDPKIEELTLEDGTIMKKLVANFDEVQKISEEKYKNFDLMVLGTDSAHFKASIAFSDDWFLMSSSNDLLKKALSDFSEDKSYEQNFLKKDMIVFSDQVLYMSQNFLMKNSNGAVLDFVSKYIQSVFSGEKFFADGVALKTNIELNN